MNEHCLTEELVKDSYLSVEQATEEPKKDILLSLFVQYKDKMAEYERIVASTGVRLNSLQDLTEEVFLRIGDNLPGINTALSSTEAQADRLLDYFRRESGILDSDKRESTSDLGKLSRASNYLIKVVNDQSDAFLQMSEMMKRIDNIKNSIESVRDFSSEMEMLSLNAAIVAIKAGGAGRTLNPITVELKKMANAAILLIDDIVKTSDQLAEKYNTFRELSENQARSCKLEVEQTSGQLTGKYEGLQSSILGLVDRLDQILTVVKNSKQPIGSIMNTLQVQDILKQCTDHVRHSLEEASSDWAALSGETALTGLQPEQLLDVIAFQERVPMLCVQLLDDIDSRLEDSVKELADGFGTIGDLLKGVTTCAQGDTAASLDDSSIDKVENSFKDVESVVMDTAVMIQNAANSWEQLWSTAIGLEAMFEVLEGQFRHLKKVTNFHFINIPIKIEVARSAELAKDGELSQRVEGLAEYISTEMKQSHKTIVQDYQFLNQMVASMNKHKKDIEANLGSIALDVDDLLSNFYKAKEQVKTTLSSVCDHVSNLAKLVQSSLSDLDRINGVIEQNRELKGEFQKLASMAGEAIRSIQLATDTSGWELHDERLKDMVDKFTVLVHKKIAGDLYGINVESGNQEGELILF